MPGTPPPALIPPPEGIFRTFEDLMASVQRVAKDQGYGIVKLRASNYRDGKPTRYDLVCDRGGVKYNSTAKKRNPSTRKIDCPFRAKAVCEVQLGNQWRFALQEARHNHEPRQPNGPQTTENAPIATSIRSFTNKIDRLSHDMLNGLMRIEQRLDVIEKRMENLEARAAGYEPRFQNIEQRMQQMEGPRMDGLPMDDVEQRLLASQVLWEAHNPQAPPARPPSRMPASSGDAVTGSSAGIDTEVSLSGSNLFLSSHAERLEAAGVSGPNVDGKGGGLGQEALMAPKEPSPAL